MASPSPLESNSFLQLIGGTGLSGAVRGWVGLCDLWAI
jgi:hypothetical protein